MRPSYCLRLIFQSSSPSLAAEVADNAGTFRYTIRNIYNVTVFNGPRGHMEELQRVFGYLQKYTGGSIPLTLRTLFERETVYTTGQQWLNSTPMPRKISQMTCSVRMEARLTVYVDADHARNKCHAVQSQDHTTE
jgi:hypothetical protein